MSDVVDLVTLLMQCHARRKGEGGRTHLILKLGFFLLNFSDEGFLCFEWVKWNFTTLDLHGKLFLASRGKIHHSPLKKILPLRMCSVTILLNWNTTFDFTSH